MTLPTRADLTLTGPHWAFALDVYSQPGVAAACIKLQDRYDLDVNVLLVAAYCAVELGKILNEAEVAQLDDAVYEWRENIVQPLRGVRKYLKKHFGCPASEHYREQVKCLEISGEQIEQAILAHRVNQYPAEVGGRSGTVHGAIQTVVALYRTRMHDATRSNDGLTSEALEVIANAASTYRSRRS